jgi:hypothetical protein
MDLDLNLEHCDDLQHLLANGVLKRGTWACAVAMQTINFGLASLTDSQRSVYEAVITPALEQLARN